ncbi:unnamed protein product [Ilex paraguariensis]|uniref:C3H1-type domain-containing protein n=1 Tax=Ilex paraguariensis TaxID=185542 RepID=A0ABC8U2A4_9AQUA
MATHFIGGKGQLRKCNPRGGAIPKFSGSRKKGDVSRMPVGNVNCTLKGGAIKGYEGDVGDSDAVDASSVVEVNNSGCSDALGNAVEELGNAVKGTRSLGGADRDAGSCEAFQRGKGGCKLGIGCGRPHPRMLGNDALEISNVVRGARR